MIKIGILLFEGVEELDVVGPYEVFAWAGVKREDFATVFTVAQTTDVVRCNKGMRVIPDYSFDSAPPLDVLLVPGGSGVMKQTSNEEVLAYVREQASRCSWVTSVCTGAWLLVAAGPAAGKRVTTYWGLASELRKVPGAGEVFDDVRYMRDGNLVTSAGVSAGIDMALWLVGQWADPAYARLVQKGIEYYPAPPYTAQV
jgi:transcriptional regulator GlxA family with amidase domain